jgi:hypothetical protein
VDLMIIGFAGRAGSGKSTACKILVSLGYEELNFADPLKVMVIQLIPGTPMEYLYDQDQKALPRDIQVSSLMLQALLHDYKIYNLTFDQDLYHFRNFRMVLQFLGDLLKLHDPAYWVKLTMSKVQPNKNYVIGDVRYDAEANAIKEAGGSIVLITRPGTNLNDTHSSEQLELTTDYALVNTDIKLFKRDILAVEGLSRRGQKQGQKF